LLLISKKGGSFQRGGANPGVRESHVKAKDARELDKRNGMEKKAK